MASLETIEGVGAKTAGQFRKAGIRGTVGLLNKGGTRAGRKEIAKASGISEKMVLECVNRCDLMRVKGVGEEYSDLLEHAGVDTVKELRNRNVDNLHAKMAEINAKKKLVRRPPSLGEVKRWVAHAKKLKPAVTY